MFISPTGAVGIRTTSPAYTLDVNGFIRGTNVSPSDSRLKTNVRTLDHALDDVARLRGVRFDWKKDGHPSIGVIAQELEKVYPELVVTDPEGMKAVQYDKLTGVLIESTKELRDENKALRDENERLEARLARIENALALQH
jgi:Chaperone of endosialidase